MAVKTAGNSPAFTPEQLQSVRGALLSPRRLKTEVLGGLVVLSVVAPCDLGTLAAERHCVELHRSVDMELFDEVAAGTNSGKDFGSRVVRT